MLWQPGIASNLESTANSRLSGEHSYELHVIVLERTLLFNVAQMTHQLRYMERQNLKYK